MDIKTDQDWKAFYLRKFQDLGTAEKNLNHYQQSYPRDLRHDAWCAQIAQLPLIEQCVQLDIAHEQVVGLPYGKKPEIDAFNYFSAQGFVGAYCEGGPVLLLIRAAALDVLAQINIFGRSDACTRFTEAQFTAYKESSELILDAIRNTDETQVVRHFTEIYSYPEIPEYYPGLTADTMSSLFLAIGATRLAVITAAMMENPYSYRAGWPDLTIVKGSDMHWVEIKTTDRLHMSQIMTIFRMKPLLPGSVRVLQLTKAKPSRHGQALNKVQLLGGTRSVAGLHGVVQTSGAASRYSTPSSSGPAPLTIAAARACSVSTVSPGNRSTSAGSRAPPPRRPITSLSCAS